VKLKRKPIRRRGWIISFARMLALLCVAAGLWLAGCSIELGPGSDADPAPNPSDDRPVEKVAVRFRNLTQTEAIDVEFYFSPQLLDILPDDLFQDAYRVRANIGVAGTGILVPKSQDVLEFECGDHVTLGTTGGTFLDNETGEPRGTGVPRWAQNGPLNLCGHIVTIDFMAAGEGFETAIRLTPAVP
jgi:hypothetical protein